MSASAQDGKFSFTISSKVNTSAGIFKDDSILVRTLWNNVSYAPGTYTKYWDGADDYGVPLTSPAATYKVKVISSNVSYSWEGTIGNASDSMAGSTKHRGYYHCMRGLAFGPTYGYFCTGYSEGSPSFAKFNINTPNQKINITVSPSVSTADINYVATDGVKVYWGASDANATSNSFVFGTNVSNDTYVNFSNGTTYAPLYRSTLNVISYLNVANSDITGLAVQKSGNYLFVTRAGLNQVQVLNKTTGALVNTLTYTTPKGICADGSDNLWMISGSGTTSKYTVNADGSLSSPILTLSGLISPLAIQVSNDGTLVTVADGGTSQQLKFFDNNTGAASTTMGTIGGYMADPTVNNSKFYFSDINGATTGNEGKLPFIAFQPNGSFWINDPGNYRVQEYNSSKSYINTIMSLGSNYSVWVDKNNIQRVWAGYLEFAVDYTKPLTGKTGWTLVKNWGAVISGTTYDGFTKFKFPITLSNGRTYAFLKNGYNMELVEFPATGQIRFSGLLKPINIVLCNDGSIQDYSESANVATLKRYPQTGFDGLGNPTWSTTSETLYSAQTSATTGNPVAAPKNQVFSSLNKVVLFNYNAMVGWAGVTPSTGYHLGLMQKGANNSYLFQTEKSTHRNYSGNYPNAGWFDVGNLVNNYAGGDVNIVDHNIITSYHGEFWKNSQTNKYNHYYDNGLAIGQFGITRPEVSGNAAAGMAGNALTPIVVKDGNGNMYLYHGDESDHAAVHRWKIAGLNSISEQTVTINYPSAFVTPVIGYTDLMKDLPFDNTSLPNNTVGWTRNPIGNVTTDPYSNYFTVATSVLNYDKLSYPDVNIRFAFTGVATNTVSRSLGVNNVTSSWKITGEVAYPGNMPNGNSIAQFLEVLDANGKVLTTFYPSIDRNNPITVYLKGNTKNIFSVNGESAGKAILEPLTPFEINVVNGVVTFIYGNYPPVSTSISDATGNWKTPATLRCKFVATLNGTVYAANLGINNLKFYTDYNIAQPANIAPLASAGTDKVITLPTNSTSLTGSGTDSDGSISSYSWVKISGPTTGTIATANTATTAINSLVQGIYKFELTVTDNNGAIGKDTVQVTVNAAGNIAPVASAGTDKVITLPTNSTSLTGSGTDSDGSISSYSWVKISGPTTGAISTANTATTAINSLVQGVYKFELTVTDNNGAIGKDTVQVTVNAAGNIAPVASAGTDKVITLPANSTSLTGSGTDADGSIINYLWTKISGPSAFNIVNPNLSAININGLVQGIYQFELMVTDNFGAVGKDTVSVRVNANNSINELPTANAGADIGIVLPINYAFLIGSGTDLDGSIVSYSWKVINGPAGYSIINPGLSSSKIEGLFQGVYLLELSVIDNNGAIASDTLKITVSSARLSSNTTNEFKVYPNPVNSIANLSITSANIYTKLSVSVIDMSGRTVKFMELVTSNSLTLLKLNMASLSDGYYVISLLFDDGKRLSSKVIKYSGK
jgi:rhamnose utilization protein RhaD (predicted bifunctional aldolase and dehydrogenase)